MGQISTNGVYVKDGKTIEVEKKAYSVNPANKADIVYFSNGLTVKVQPNSDFSINSFFQDVITTNDFHKAEFGDSSLSATLLSGKLLLSYNGTTNSSCVISTPMADIELYRGLFYFEVSEKNAIMAVIDGSFKCYNGKKEVIINAGQAIIAKPNTVGILEDRVELSTGKVNANAVKDFREESKEIVNSINSIIFIRIDGKTIGISL
jgi:hypothetical protein